MLALRVRHISTFFSRVSPLIIADVTIVRTYSGAHTLKADPLTAAEILKNTLYRSDYTFYNDLGMASASLLCNSFGRQLNFSHTSGSLRTEFSHTSGSEQLNVWWLFPPSLFLPLPWQPCSPNDTQDIFPGHELYDVLTSEECV